MKLLISALLICCCNATFAGGSVVAQVVEMQISAWEAGRAPPKLVAAGVDLSLADIYQVQTDFTAHMFAGQFADGFKGGLTSRGDPQRFGLEQPLAGVLPPGSALQKLNGKFELDISNYHRAMVELELGFVFAKPITKSEPSLQEIKAAVSAVFPVLELPDLGFAGEGKLHGKDVIAANASAKHYIKGLQAINPVTEINDLALKLYRDEELIVQGVGSDAMGDQWRALQWLVGQRLSAGWTIEAGQILITGAIGKMVPLQPGQYRAEYGDQASIHLDVH